MFALNRATKVFVRTGATDMRLSFNGLYALVSTVLRQDPLSGHLFTFCNRARTRIKVLYFDGSGLWVCAKRLERGTFAWPQDGQSEIDATHLQALLTGFEIEPRQRWYRR
jgi:transposase